MCFRGLRIITARQRSCLKVMFSQACVYSRGGGRVLGPFKRVGHLWSFALLGGGLGYGGGRVGYLAGTTKAGGMHPTGMLSFLSLFQDFTIQLRTAFCFPRPVMMKHVKQFQGNFISLPVTLGNL